MRSRATWPTCGRSPCHDRAVHAPGACRGRRAVRRTAALLGTDEPARRARRDVAHDALVRAILDLAPKLGAFAFRCDAGVKPGIRGGGMRRYGTPGASDVIAIVAGAFVAIEVKTGTGRQTEAQRAFAEKVQRAGGRYVVVRSVEDAARALGNSRLIIGRHEPRALRA